MKQTVEIIKALADENRARIAMMLRVRPMCVCEIDAILDIALSTISSHLKVMKSAGIIKDKKDGRWVVYSSCEETLLVNDILDTIEKHLENDETFLNDRKKVNEVSKDVCFKN
ncbi:ArsR/SmtB family transcription factor [Limisalsivibrio acetivorans]|uniref:ArsR/SmtB family transcription factor n=1 Tax=Limisalsivibrio acetivorans TaxID=1304888 RepID=UPI0003B39ADA|nr:metalloregulator ArsR/SmtB family transcription factor [Limisalsivibrio acetivorans]